MSRESIGGNLAFLGIFKSKEEKDRDAATAAMALVFARATNVIKHLESDFSTAQRRVAAECTVDAVMQTPRTIAAVEQMQAKIRLFDQDPTGEGPLHFGTGLASYLVLAWCSLEQLKGTYWIGASFHLTVVEGALKGFIERAGVPPWKALYIEDKGAFEQERQAYLAARSLG